MDDCAVREVKDMLLYHGSNVEIRKPDLKMSRRYLDFGAGFYLTSNNEQAIQFAGKVALRAVKMSKKPGVATVSVYDFDLDAENPLYIKTFHRTNDEWLDYVITNRRGEIWDEDYDIVIGPVADDDVFAVIEFYESGLFTKKQVFGALKIKKRFNQYTFKTSDAIKTLQSIKSHTY